MSIMEKNSPWCATASLEAFDVSKDIKAAVGAGISIVVTNLVISIKTAGAISFFIQDDNGTPVKVFDGPGSLPVGTYQFHLEKGVKLTANKKLEILPAGAGLVMFVIAEGYQEFS